MSGHAKLSPSAASRWMVCPGSVALSADMPSKSSEFAEEGTKAHALAEELLKAWDGDIDAIVESAATDMLDHVFVYVEHIVELFKTASELHIEKRVEVNEDVYGTADAIVWDEKTGTLYVRDLKYGAGVPVEVKDNLQLKIYALAALLTCGYKAKTVDVGIVQPRCPHSDGPIRTTQFNAVDLIDFHAELLEAIERTKQKDAALAPGEKQCRFCLAAPKCPALKDKAQHVAKQVFAPGLPYDAADLAETLEWLPVLEGWVKNVREFAYAEAERGNAIPRFKLVAKRATRKWRNPSAVEEALSQHLGHSDLYDEPSLKTPAVIEKLLAKDQRSLLEDLCIKESSGHTLVHESDKREAIRVDAKSAFEGA